MPLNIWKQPYGGRSGMWIEHPNSPYTVSGSAIQTYDFTGLLDALYSGYRFEALIYSTHAGGSLFSDRVNAASCVTSRETVYGSAGSVAAGWTTTGTPGPQISQDTFGSVCFEIPNAKANLSWRPLLHREERGSTNQILLFSAGGLTTPATTVEIVSLGLGGDSADSIGIGSILRLFMRLA